MYMDWLLFNYLDLFADEESRGGKGKRSCFMTSSELLEQLDGDPSLDELIVEAQVYTEPVAAWRSLSLFAGSHYYVVLETQNWWWSVELRDKSVVIQRGKNFSSVQNRCQGQYRRYRLLHNGPTLEYSLLCTGPSVRDIIAAMYREGFFCGTAVSGQVSSQTLSKFVCQLCKCVHDKA